VAHHHACAWYACVSSVKQHCERLDAAFRLSDFDSPDTGWQPTAQAAAVCAEFAPADLSITPSVPAPAKQSLLSTRLDEETLNYAMSDLSVLTPRQKVHWMAATLPGAGAWLLADPDPRKGHAMSPARCMVLLRRRLGSPIYETEGPCPQCGALSDIYGDHAIACAAGGDRTRRHHRVRDSVAAFAAAAGHAPAVEPLGLLPLRPDDVGIPEDGGGGRAAAPPRRAAAGPLRRPADVCSKESGIKSWNKAGGTHIKKSVRPGRSSPGT
jgi:hypothetical protein